MLYATWIERVEDAVADEEALQALADQAADDTDLSDYEREAVQGRCETYLENFDDQRQARLLVAVDAKGGAAVDDEIPDFDLAYDFSREDARIDEATYAEKLHPRDRLGRWRESVGKLHTISKADVIAGKVPGFKHDPEMSRGIAAHMYDREHITIGPGGYQGEMLDPLLMAHEIGHEVANHVFRSAPGMSVSNVPEVMAFRGEGQTMKAGAGYAPTFDNPFGLSPRAEEMVADAYRELLFFGLPEDDPTEGERTKAKRRLLQVVARAARDLGLPDRRIYRYTKDGETLLIEGFEEASYTERLHPRDRLGRWRDIPEVPRARGDLLVGKAMHRLYDGFEFGGIRSMVLTNSTEDGFRTVTGVLLHDPDDSGEPLTVGTFETTAFREKGALVLQRDLIEVHPEFQNRGFATAFYAHEDREAVAYGVERIELSASLATGGYTWARAGFEFQTEGDSDGPEIARARSVAALWATHGWTKAADEEGSLEASVGQERAGKLRALRARVGEEAWSAFAARFPETAEGDITEVEEGWFAYEHEIAMYGRDGTHWEEDGHDLWLGKAFMLGAGWEGVRYLQAPLEEAAGEYAGKPCHRVREVYEGWRAARRIHDAPDDIRGDDEDGFWDAVEAVL